MGRNGRHGWPTYSPTSAVSGEEEEQQLLNMQGDVAESTNTAVLEPFGIWFLTSAAEPTWDEGVATEVTKDHLTHSFRSLDWEVDTLQLMVLEEERRLKHANVASERSLVIMRSLARNPEYEFSAAFFTS